MVISYIAPFGSRLRPIVCPDDSKITIKIIGRFSSLVIIDGQREAVVNGNDRIDIRVSDERLTFIELKNSFYDRLREKLIKDVVN
jgi:NAD+ kinase